MVRGIACITNWLHLSGNNSCHLLSLYYVLGVEASYLHLWFQPGLEQQEHSKVFFTRLCTLTKRHPRVGLGPLHPLPTCGEASARGLRQRRGQTPRARRGSGREKRIRPPSLNDSHVQPTGSAWPLRICLSTCWTYYPSTGLHMGDRSNKYGLSLWDFSLDVLLVALLFCCDPCWEGLSERKGPVGVRCLPVWHHCSGDGSFTGDSHQISGARTALWYSHLDYVPFLSKVLSFLLRHQWAVLSMIMSQFVWDGPGLHPGQCPFFILWGVLIWMIGEGNGNSLQCSCLENPRDRGAWWAAVSGVAQSQTRLKRHSNKQQQHLDDKSSGPPISL